MAANNKLNVGEIVVVSAGSSAFVASFLPWAGSFRFSVNAWSTGLLPTYTWVGIFGLLMVASVLVATFSTLNLPERLGTFSFPQLYVVLSAVSCLLCVSFLIAGELFSVGYWLSLLASIAMVVGSVLILREEATGGSRPVAAPGAPQAYPPVQQPSQAQPGAQQQPQPGPIGQTPGQPTSQPGPGQPQGQQGSASPAPPPPPPPPPAE